MTIFTHESNPSGTVFTVKDGSLSGFPAPETVVSTLPATFDAAEVDITGKYW